MSRRRRAILFGLAAAACAAFAARAVSGYGRSVEAQLGPLRPALVAKAALPAKRTIRRADAGELEVRRVPTRFLPPGVLTDPAEAVGNQPTAVIPAGSYVLGAQLTEPGSGAHRPRAGLPAGRTPVEISVTGAQALATQPGGGSGPRVDVVVTTEPHTDSADGRTYVAARGVRLLSLRAADPSAGSGVTPALPDASVATLAVTRPEALSLIHAQNFAREVRLVASGD